MVTTAKKIGLGLLGGGFVRPQQFGAAGNGIVDDSDAIEAANAVAVLKRIPLVFSGEFLIRRAVHPTSRAVWRGRGGKIKIADGVQSALTSNASSGTKVIPVTSVAGFRVGQDVSIFDDSHTGYGLGDSNRIVSIDAGAKTLTLLANLKNSYTTANNAKISTSFSAIDLCTVTYTDGFGLTLCTAGQTDVTIEDLEIDGNLTNQIVGNYDDTQCGIHLGNSHRAIIRRNNIKNNVFGGIINSHYLDGSFDGCENVLIEDNRVTNTLRKGALHDHGLKNSIVRRNAVDTCTQDYAIYLKECYDNLYEGNTIAGGAPYGFWVVDSSRNTIKGGSVSQTTNDGAIVTSDTGSTADIIVDGVAFSNIGRYGVYCTDTPTGFIARNNTVSQCTNYPINVLSAGAQVRNNTVTAPSGVNGIKVSGSATDAIVDGNNITGVNTFGILSEKDRTTITGNTINSGTAAGLRITGENCVVTNNAITTSAFYPMSFVGTVGATTTHSGNTKNGVPNETYAT
jgi:parallel beta-helix repeat protein